jgi:hypothetical protein
VHQGNAGRKQGCISANHGHIFAHTDAAAWQTCSILSHKGGIFANPVRAGFVCAGNRTALGDAGIFVAKVLSSLRDLLAFVARFPSTEVLGYFHNAMVHDSLQE